MLCDPSGRIIDYLRLSITDRCNLRCRYCMPARGARFVAHGDYLAPDELIRLASIFARLGVSKLRVTGGEPLLRQDASRLLACFAAIPGIRDLTLTTNGVRLAECAMALRQAGVGRINISLDSLHPERFRRITRCGRLADVLRGIDAAQAAGFQRIRLNTVVLLGRNDDELLDLARFALARELDIAFIEAMPIGPEAGRQHRDHFIRAHEVRRRLGAELSLLPTAHTSAGPARYYCVPGYSSHVGFIAPHSERFCKHCNRVRVTAAGLLAPCLDHEYASDLRRLLRAHPHDDGPIGQAILNALASKPSGHRFASARPAIAVRQMYRTGG